MGRKSQFLELTLAGKICEGPVSFRPFSRREQTSLLQIAKMLKAARSDQRIKAVLVIVKNFSIGWAQIEELHRLFADLQEAGKRLLIFLEQVTNKTYYLAAPADKIYLPPSASFDLVGLRSEVLFFKNLLSYLGVEPELFNIGEYKSAAEIFQREGMSGKSRSMTNSILEDLQARLVALVATNRNVTATRVREWINSGPHTARTALGGGMVDGLCYEDELRPALELQFPGIRSVRSIRSDPKDGFVRRLLTFYRPQIALMVADGVISSGHSRRNRGQRPVLGTETLISFLKDARRRRRVRAIVLRLNSPGGATLASDLIWREIKLANQLKPVIVSFGNVGASGGYYLATAARTILANPSTLTGSIGVVGGKFNIKGLLKKVGVTSDAVEKGSHSGYASATRPFSQDEAEAIRKQMKDFYEELFLPKVAESRKRSVAEVRKLAEGRVWTGAQAHSHGLIDSIGGLDEALELARELAGLAKKKSRIVHYLQRRSLLELLPLPASQSLCSERILAIMPEIIRIH